jgi:hypothetical protein
MISRLVRGSALTFTSWKMPAWKTCSLSVLKNFRLLNLVGAPVVAVVAMPIWPGIPG